LDEIRDSGGMKNDILDSMFVQSLVLRLLFQEKPVLHSWETSITNRQYLLVFSIYYKQMHTHWAMLWSWR